ncbi:MAG: hypothetical protein BGN83_21260 [Rhizobium sp. 63-7]|nr:MAG: hypothetical protein BGN83_21260 [Rhizobium sp. 63-7]
MVAVPPSEGLERRRVRAARRLGDAKSLQPQLTGGDFRQVLAFLPLIAMPQDGAHDVHLRMAGAAVAAGSLYLLKDRRRRRKRQAGPAIFFRNERREITGFGQRIDEFAGVGAFPFKLLPVVARKPGTKLRHFRSNFGIILNRHVFSFLWG